MLNFVAILRNNIRKIKSSSRAMIWVCITLNSKDIKGVQGWQVQDRIS